MGLLNFSRCCFVMFLITMDLRFLRCSPIPILPDFLKSRSSALPAEENGFLRKQDIEISTPNPPSALENLVDSKLPQRPANFHDFKQMRAQRNSDLPKALIAKQALMQLGGSRQSADNKHGLKAQQKTKDFTLPLKPSRELGVQYKDNIPANPEVPSRNNEEAQNSVLLPHTQPTVHTDLPLKNGMSLINLGHLDLKTDMCKAYHFKETVRHHGCKSVNIDNNMCYGQCNSFYIPKRFVSCSYCAPTRQEVVGVRLECPGQNPDFVIKKVSVVKECGCKDCGLEHH